MLDLPAGRQVLDLPCRQAGAGWHSRIDRYILRPFYVLFTQRIVGVDLSYTNLLNGKSGSGVS